MSTITGLFPVIPQQTGAPPHSTVADKVNQRYQRHFQTYCNQAQAMKPLLDAWKISQDSWARWQSRSPDERGAEVQEKIREYRKYRKLREDADALLTDFNEAVAQCTPHTLTQAGVSELASMGVDLMPAKKRYEQLIEHTEKVQQLSTQINNDLEQLADCLEPLASKHAYQSSQSLLPFFVSYSMTQIWNQSRHPYIKSYREQQEKQDEELAAAQQAKKK